MKKVILLIVATVTLYSCKQDNPQQKMLAQIEKDIKDNAMGNDIGYQPGQLDTTIVVTNQQLKSFFESSLNRPIDSLIPFYTQYYEKAKANNEGELYYVWKFMVQKMNEVKASPDKVNFTVMKYNYSINNVFQKGSRVSVENYYFFNGSDSLIAHCDPTEIQDMKRQYVKYDVQPYLFILGDKVTGVNN